MLQKINILVLMATYNGSKYISEQIDSVLMQEGVNIKLLISDDNSTDDTILIINKYLNDSRVSLVENKNRSGSAAKNFLNLVKIVDNPENYDFFAFCDQDDIWLSNKLLQATQCLKSDNADLYLSNLIKWDQKSGKKDLIKKNYSQKKYDFLFEGGSAGCTYVFTNAFYNKSKIALSQLKLTEWKNFSHDWYFYFFARTNNFKVFIDKNAYILYRIHDTNVHGQLNSFTYNAIKERLKMIREGWYFEQIEGFKNLLDENSESKKIYKLYSQNLLTRIYVIFYYNLSLMRSTNKFFMFCAVSLFIKKR